MASVGEKTVGIFVYGRSWHMEALSANNSLLMAVHIAMHRYCLLTEYSSL